MSPGARTPPAGPIIGMRTPRSVGADVVRLNAAGTQGQTGGLEPGTNHVDLSTMEEWQLQPLLLRHRHLIAPEGAGCEHLVVGVGPEGLHGVRALLRYARHHGRWFEDLYLFSRSSGSLRRIGSWLEDSSCCCRRRRETATRTCRRAAQVLRVRLRFSDPRHQESPLPAGASNTLRSSTSSMARSTSRDLARSAVRACPSGTCQSPRSERHQRSSAPCPQGSIRGGRSRSRRTP